MQVRLAAQVIFHYSAAPQCRARGTRLFAGRNCRADLFDSRHQPHTTQPLAGRSLFGADRARAVPYRQCHDA